MHSMIFRDLAYQLPALTQKHHHITFAGLDRYNAPTRESSPF